MSKRDRKIITGRIAEIESTLTHTHPSASTRQRLQDERTSLIEKLRATKGPQG